MERTIPATLAGEPHPSAVRPALTLSLSVVTPHPIHFSAVCDEEV